ncbi:MAG: hypothetical protein Q4Q22_08655, partial [Methanosphaera sp.]|nr:hypothetical protein [Methanosphaera sp.]
GNYNLYNGNFNLTINDSLIYNNNGSTPNPTQPYGFYKNITNSIVSDNFPFTVVKENNKYNIEILNVDGVTYKG